MSITINQQPSQVSPAYNELVYVATSTQTNQPNFKYVFDVYNGSGTRLSRLKLPARPSDSRGVFDAKRVLQSYVSFDLGSINEASDFNPCANSVFQYSVRIGEEYGSTPAVQSTFVTGDTKYTFNGTIDWQDFPSYSQNDHILRRTVTGGHYLSNSPLEQDIELTDNAWLYMMVNPAGTASAVGYVQVKTYNESGLISSTTINNLWAQSYGIFRLPSGPANLNAHSAGFISSNVTYYTVQIFDDLSGATSELMRYDIVDNSRFDVVRLHFLNRKGGFDCFSFPMKSRETVSISRQNYQKRYGSTTGTAWTYHTYDRGKMQFDTRTQRKFKISSDWLTEAESTWLEELVSSPEVYQETNGKLIAVNLSAPTYEKKKKQNENLFSLQLDMEYCFDQPRQRG